jgi:hypothetical protein
MLDKIKNVMILLIILALTITAYGIWGNSGFVIALIVGFIFEGWFWHRIIRPKRSLSKF